MLRRRDQDRDIKNPRPMLFCLLYTIDTSDNESQQSRACKLPFAFQVKLIDTSVGSIYFSWDDVHCRLSISRCGREKSLRGVRHCTMKPPDLDCITRSNLGEIHGNVHVALVDCFGKPACWWNKLSWEWKDQKKKMKNIFLIEFINAVNRTLTNTIIESAGLSGKSVACR